MAKGKVVGVIKVLHRTPFKPTLPWLEVFDLLASQAAITVDHAQLLAALTQKNLDLRLAYEETIEGWARALTPAGQGHRKALQTGHGTDPGAVCGVGDVR